MLPLSCRTCASCCYLRLASSCTRAASISLIFSSKDLRNRCLSMFVNAAFMVWLLLADSPASSSLPQSSRISPSSCYTLLSLSAFASSICRLRTEISSFFCGRVFKHLKRNTDNDAEDLRALGLKGQTLLIRLKQLPDRVCQRLHLCMCHLLRALQDRG